MATKSSNQGKMNRSHNYLILNKKFLVLGSCGNKHAFCIKVFVKSDAGGTHLFSWNNVEFPEFCPTSLILLYMLLIVTSPHLSYAYPAQLMVYIPTLYLTNPRKKLIYKLHHSTQGNAVAQLSYKCPVYAGGGVVPHCLEIGIYHEYQHKACIIILKK